MHSYSTDSNERIQVPFYLAVLGILFAWGLSRLTNSLNISIPWWLDAPAAMGFYALVYNFFNQTAWKWSWLRKTNIIQTPNLNGIWSGHFFTSYDGHTEQKQATVEIKQTWSDICIVFKNGTSRSKSITASILTKSGEGIVLSYEYQNEPGYTTVSTMQMHKGFTRLVLTTPQRLEGEYYTGRGRLSHGSMSFQLN
ncbi:MAG TPA: hypothetical protein VMS09_19095 [Paenibacillus sp.]|uniref:Cap15 family cyclic dinucleotide receptor domain-containing protein n=1 Tax=Paenibacillus sp. TaxID=58172 RepID=UPI002BAAF77D|nr:hypothetical protein [Paenibacillus sp.]HUC94094.1 hypothetical protein [Paenibacillus sp.]